MSIRLDQPVREGEEPDRGADQPGKVEPLLARRVLRLVDERSRRQHADDPHRHVDEEDPTPADPLGDHTADQRADRQGQRGDPRPDPDCGAAQPWREGCGDDRERRRVHQRRADALDGAGGDQRRRAAGEPAPERRAGEDHEARDEDRAPAEQVGELAAREQEHAERQRVGVHDPLELGHRDAEVGADRRQRHVHHRVVEHDHEQAERNRDQRPPLPVLIREEPCPHRYPPSSPPACSRWASSVHICGRIGHLSSRRHHPWTIVAARLTQRRTRPATWPC